MEHTNTTGQVYILTAFPVEKGFSIVSNNLQGVIPLRGKIIYLL